MDLWKYEECRACGRTIRDSRLARQVENVLLGGLGGVAYESLGQYDKAIEHHKQTLVISEIDDWMSEGKTLGNLGNAYGKLARCWAASASPTSRSGSTRRRSSTTSRRSSSAAR